MPQMAPLNWLSLYIMFMVLFIMIMIMNYYFFMYKNMMNKKSNMIKYPINWKW